MTATATKRCGRSGCDGEIDDEGYCDLCGHRAAPTPAVGGAAPSGGAAPVTGASAGGPAGPVSAAQPVTGSSGLSSSSRHTGVLGTGLVDLPPVPNRDPTEVVLTEPAVPEHRRFCACGAPVGRGRDGRPGRTTGFCPRDGQPFSFVPDLRPGDLVGGQYEIQGCLAHGGLGWIYLAADRNLDGMWVVLKGLLDTTDPAAIAAAEAERRFLIAVDHPNIVKILNFVQHRDARTGAVSGYLVMEYVGGLPLQDLLQQRLREQGETLPPRQSIPYALEVLQAFDYLHGRDMLYCDLKPANLIQVGQRLKLIDLGAVRRVDDLASDVWGTVGYQAPEIETDGPSVSSDLYTVGRTLAVLSIPFSPAVAGPDGPREAPLPPPAVGDNESLHRLLRRATDPDPAARFATAVEMAAQLTGVLREIRAVEDGVPYPAPSSLFGPERGVAATGLAADGRRVLAALDPAEAVTALPVPLLDPADPAASALAGLAGRHPDELLALVASLPATPEAQLTRLRVIVEQNRSSAGTALSEVEQSLPGDWRVAWYRAGYLLVTGRAAEAVAAFDQQLSRFPGEIAPKLALAVSLELAGESSRAAHWYDTVWRTDHGYVGAAFGLARTRPSALSVLGQVPASSTHHLAAQVALVADAVRGTRPPDAAVLVDAGRRLIALDRLESAHRAALSAELLETALRLLATPGSDPRLALLGSPFTEPGIRQQLEQVYRTLARAATGRAARSRLVDRANAVRPRTWL